MTKDRVSTLCRTLDEQVEAFRQRPLEGAYPYVLGCPWQRCTVHFTREMVMHCQRDRRGLVAAALREIFNAEGYEPAKECASSSNRAFKYGRNGSKQLRAESREGPGA